MELSKIKGIGPKTLNILGRLGINSTYELLTYYPFRYNFIKRSDISTLNQDDQIVIDGVVETNATVVYLKNHKDKMTFKLNTNNTLLNVVIFNRGFLKNKIIIGTKITVIGKYDKKNNTVVCSDLRFSLLGNTIKIEPIYHVTTGINSSQINHLINSVDVDLVDYVPRYLALEYGFKDKTFCIREMHNPHNYEMLKQAINRLKYEELFVFMAKINYLKSKKIQEGLKRKVEMDRVQQFIDQLPFRLTSDQLKAVEEIYDDLTSERRMNRLLQGDVGSGKTIVAFIALYINYLAGYQGALMAPTEILAKQHYHNISNLLPNLRVCLLTGKLKTKEKKEIYSGLEDGSIDIVIGTHALINEGVKYKNLGLVITDEQHRFGVNQRSNLKNKGVMPDVLYMSATPIPRTYAITLFGDMDISSIKTKPAGRKEVITYLKKEQDITDVLSMMLEQLKKGHQVYVIAPLIEESNKIELENVIKLRDKMNLAFGKYFTVGMMHGKLSNQEKEEVMLRFKNNEINILISTTVIEVGVDVPNATMMVVFDSYRFGLSALHQLRGRVGRSDLQSYFIMISNDEAERLNILTKTSDGFSISEADFKLRGSGDLFGTRQSGDMQFKLADLRKDYDLVVKAKEDSLQFLKNHDLECQYIYDDIVDGLDCLD